MTKSMPPSGSYGSGLMQPTVRLQHITVVESSPTRMEMKVLFNDSNEFSWLREDPSGNRVPVKYDFHIEHVITGSTDPSGRENFVLSNSGKVGSEATQVLARKHKRLLDSGAPQGVVIQHQLIIWAAKLEDAGKYFGVTKIPQPNGLSVLQETEFRLEVRPQPRFPLLPVQPPEFIRPLTLRTKTVPGQSNPVLELTCSVASNPAPRCLFYKNNSPVPVVILPLLTSEQDKTDITLRSFSGKYAVVSSPYRQSVVSATVGYLRNLILLIHNLGPEDVATYTCRAWNYTGKTETEAKVLRSDLQVPPADQSPSPQYEQTGSLSDRMRQAQMETMKSARDIESTARTHGDVMPPNRHVDSRPPLPSSAGNTLNRSQLPGDRDRFFEAADKTLQLHSRVLDLERKFYLHSCPHSLPSGRTKSTSSHPISRPFRMCLGHNPKPKKSEAGSVRSVRRAKSMNDAQIPASCEQLRSELSDLVEDVFAHDLTPCC
ncbi:unnamed protein product [Calicophoron daubneyi]|uniref:Ig-like domain-containing protein n=1 Tax=Calicophoron daubneyi TaxID=300641 RepID=A0AAV2SW33_CALDB